MPDTMPDYEQTYDEFWRPVVENPDGTLDRESVMRELHDYRTLLGEVPKVYDEVTGGRLSKPNTPAIAVVAAAMEHVAEMEHIDLFQRAAVEHISDDGRTALCGLQLVDPDAPEPQQCPDCAAEVRSVPRWRAWLAGRLVRLAEWVER